MKILLKLGVPYCDVFGCDEVDVVATKEETITDIMSSFLKNNGLFADQMKRKGYVVNGELKAIYTKNGQLASPDIELSDGDIVQVIVPIVGG
jgi:molybdopterin converting factor small subunit